MATVAPIRSQTRQLIERCLDEMMDLASCGISPQEALLNVSKSADLAPDKIRMLARAYNTGVTLYHYKTASTFQQRIAAPKLVDAERVIKELFHHSKPEPLPVKTSSDYNARPSTLLLRRKEASRYQKQVADHHKAQQIIRYCTQLKEAITKAKPKAAEVYKQLQLQQLKCAARFEAVLDELRNYFLLDRDPVDPKEVIKNASVVYGDSVKGLVERVTKTIQYSVPPRQAVPVDWEKPPYLYVKQAVQLMEEFTSLTQLLKQIPPPQRVADQVAVTRFQRGSVIDNMMKESCLYATKVAAAVGSPIRESIINTMSTVSDLASLVKSLRELPPSAAVPLRSYDLLNRQYEASQAKVAATLMELMQNDEVISRYSADEVKQAYNKLAKTAPLAMQSPEVIKMMLRMELAGAMDVFAISKLTEMERQMRQSVAEIMRNLEEETPKTKK